MARYDRIARIAPPARDGAYPGWLALKDLDGRERDSEVGRRSRLRFLAVRLVGRLAGELDPGHVRDHCEAIREELGQLPPRDPEREALATLLGAVSEGNRYATGKAALALAHAVTEADGPWAAREICHVLQDLGRAWNDSDLAETASRLLMQLNREGVG